MKREVLLILFFGVLVLLILPGVSAKANKCQDVNAPGLETGETCEQVCARVLPGSILLRDFSTCPDDGFGTRAYCQLRDECNICGNINLSNDDLICENTVINSDADEVSCMNSFFNDGPDSKMSC